MRVRPYQRDDRASVSVLLSEIGEVRAAPPGSLSAGQASDVTVRHEVLGQTLWFNPRNPLSSTFWPAMGFHPILTVLRSGVSR